jgi:serine/threonine protein kinase
MTEPSDRPPPKRLADFEIVRRLGAGGMAEVFLAKKRGAEGTFKLLVVKRILPAFGNSRRFRTMFAEEAQLATRLNHPNIVQVYDFQDYGDEGQLLSMEYVEGPDLRRLMRAALARGSGFRRTWRLTSLPKLRRGSITRTSDATRPVLRSTSCIATSPRRIFCSATTAP